MPFFKINFFNKLVLETLPPQHFMGSHMFQSVSQRITKWAYPGEGGKNVNFEVFSHSTAFWVATRRLTQGPSQHPFLMISTRFGIDIPQCFNAFGGRFLQHGGKSFLCW